MSSKKDEPVEHIDKVEKALDGGRSTSTSSSQEFDPKLAAKIRHRIDWRLIPALGAMYGISLMDRKNVSNAAIAGMLTDLRMSRGYGYNIVNMLFFVTYILLQPFMIILCRKMGPRFFLPGICLLWGCIIIGFGFANNWSVVSDSN